MASAGEIYRNYTSTDTTSQGLTSNPLPQPPTSWGREGYFFKEWNTSRDGSGTSCQPGDNIPPAGVVYAIWYGDYIEAVKDSSGIEHPIKDIISGYITSYTETDPIFGASAAAGITSTNITTWNNKQNALTFDGTYNASTNKAATVSTVTNAINALDGGTIGTGSTTKTITSLSQSNGNVSATFSDIAFPVTSVNGQTGAVTLSASDVGALSDTTDLSIYMQKGVDYVTAGQKSGTTLGTKATAEGLNTTSSNSYTHAEGSYTVASGSAAHAEGNWTQASGSSAHAEGQNTIAEGSFSHAEGNYTIAHNKSQHVFGEFNVAENKMNPAYRGTYIEIVGNGTADTARSNARTLDWSGNETLTGKLTVGAGPTNAMDVATKQYVDTGISNITFPVTSVNGQTGAVTTAEKFVITATAISGTNYYTLDKTFADIVSAIGDNKYVTITDIDATYPYTTVVSQGIVFGATLIATGEGNQLLAITDGILVVPPDSGTNAMGIAVHSSIPLPTTSDIPSPSNTTPLMDGTAAVGNGTTWARADHVHPTDTSRAPLASPEFTGTPIAPTAAAGTNTTQIATTAFVKKAIEDALFVAEYGVTTYAEISAVLDADKPLFCYVNWNDIVCPYIGIVNNQYAFSSLGAGESTVSLYVNSSNQWSYATSNLATQSEVNAKQDALVSGTNIKTINNESILGSGNISISSGSSDVFIAEYGTTTYSEVVTASKAGKAVFAVREPSNEGYEVYALTSFAGTSSEPTYCFTQLDFGSSSVLHYITLSSTGWSPVSGVTLAPISSPTFTGTPKAPTAAVGTNTTQIATTAFVQGEKKNLVANGDSSLDISSLADLKTQLSTWFATLEDCSTAFFWFHVPTTFSPFASSGDKLVRLQRATSLWGFAEIFSDFGASSSTFRTRYFGRSDIYMNFGNGAWTDPVFIRATLGNYYDYNSRPSDANTAVPFIQQDGGLYTFKATDSMTSNKPVSDGHIIHNTWDYTGNYSTQLFLPNATTNGTSDNGNRHVQVRGCYNGTWKSWESLAWMSDVTDAINTAIGSAILASY